MTAIAQASQLALLPPLPPEMTGINLAAATAPRPAMPRSAVTCMRSSRPVTGSGRSSGTSVAMAWPRFCSPGMC